MDRQTNIQTEKIERINREKKKKIDKDRHVDWYKDIHIRMKKNERQTIIIDDKSGKRKQNFSRQKNGKHKQRNKEKIDKDRHVDWQKDRCKNEKNTKRKIDNDNRR